MKCNFWSSVKTCIDWTSFDFRFRNLLSNLPLNIIIYCVTTQPSITRSRRSVLNFQLSVLTFQWPSQRTLCKEKNISTPISVQCDNKRLLSRFLIHFIWPRYSTWPMQEWQNSAHEKNCWRLQNMTIYIHFFFYWSIRTYGVVVKASRSESVDMSSNLSGRCNSVLPLGQLRDTDPVFGTRALYIAVLSIIFSLSNHIISGYLAVTEL